MSNSDIERERFEKSARHILKCQPAEFKKISDGSYFHESTYRLFKMWQAAKQSEWIKCSDRLPTENDADERGYIWFWRPNWNCASEWHFSEIFDVGYDKSPINHFWHPKPKRPQPPKEQS